MTSDILTPAVMEWAGRAAPSTRVAPCSVRPLTGGAVARQVDQVTLHLTGHREPLELVRKGGVGPRDRRTARRAGGTPASHGDT